MPAAEWTPAPPPHDAYPHANRQEVEAFAHCFRSSDQNEGMAAFLDKRAAKFEGK